MKVLVLGSSGIIGQHMRLCVPDGVIPVWHRKYADPAHVGCDLTKPEATMGFLRAIAPNAIVNLAGECSVDKVERDPERYRYLNAEFPGVLAELAEKAGCRLIHISSQAVFDGENPPYGPSSPLGAVNEYGRQKIAAERAVSAHGALIVRPTFVLGVRPLRKVGRQNPAEQMLAGQFPQVCDRWFSPSFAPDVAAGIWAALLYDRGDRTPIHLGLPIRKSRYDVYRDLVIPLAGVKNCPEKVSHSWFPGLAARPVDTHYEAATARYYSSWEEGLRLIRRDSDSRIANDILYRARQIAMFLGISEEKAVARLNLGFGALHQAVAADFRQAAPRDDKSLLEWYRKTDAYIWELTAYHADPRWNYSGMCDGLIDRLTTAGIGRVLCLGDGVGSLTLALRRAGIDAVYHDLDGSKTAAFAAFRYWAETGETLPQKLTSGWEPDLGGGYDCVISHDFLEHVTDVAAWSRAIKDALAPGGLFFAQNAFACGSGPHGSIPMHLAANDRYEKEWDPLMQSIGLHQESSNWYRKAA